MNASIHEARPHPTYSTKTIMRGKTVVVHIGSDSERECIDVFVYDAEQARRIATQFELAAAMLEDYHEAD